MDFQVVLSNILIACLIGGLAMTVGHHGQRAAVAHLLWIAFFIKLVTPPIWQLKILIPGDKAFFSIPWTTSLSRGLLVIWFLGFLFLLLRGIVRNIRFAILLKREGVVDAQATHFVRGLLNRDGGSTNGLLRKRIEVVRFPARLSPMLFGSLLKPKIVCPDELWQLLSDEQRHAFLAHETAHYCRRDHWVRWLEWVVTAVYWWFPGVYFGRGQLERHEEACCDAWAVKRLGTTPRAYAETLLSVVDFVSEHNTKIPRIANGMQPTDTLEERLRLLMRPPKTAPLSQTMVWIIACCCGGLWLMHPVFELKAFSYSASKAELCAEVSLESDQDLSADLIVEQKPFKWPEDLPEAPHGFWNLRPNSKWADFTLLIGHASLRAEAGLGVTITPKDAAPIYFPPDEMVVMAEVPAKGRVVIGDLQGRIRLWDLQAGAAVSLIGQHSASVTSMTHHDSFGLVSSDSSGRIVRWELDSGQILASANLDGPIQTVRSNHAGDQLAVLMGDWHNPMGHGSMIVMNPRSLVIEREFTGLTAPATLIELNSPGPSLITPEPTLNPSSPREGCLQNHIKQWFVVDWQGNIHSPDRPLEIVGVLKKDLVSSLVFMQQTVSMEQIGDPPAVVVPNSNSQEVIYVEQ